MARCIVPAEGLSGLGSENRRPVNEPWMPPASDNPQCGQFRSLVITGWWFSKISWSDIVSLGNGMMILTFTQEGRLEADRILFGASISTCSSGVLKGPSGGRFPNGNWGPIVSLPVAIHAPQITLNCAMYSNILMYIHLSKVFVSTLHRSGTFHFDGTSPSFSPRFCYNLRSSMAARAGSGCYET